MKKLLTVSAILLFTANLSNAVAASVKNTSALMNITAAFITPPPVVLSGFRANFGNAPVRQWKLRSNGQWRAHFTRNGIAWEATFSSAGSLVKSEPA